jgi:esterase/lipase
MPEEGLAAGEVWKIQGALHEGEEPDIHAEIRRVLGDEDAQFWLCEPNVRFGGRCPEEVIKEGGEFWIRDVLRSYMHVGSS